MADDVLPAGRSPPPITDAHMREMLRKARPYTVVILHKTPRRDDPGADDVVWEHGRRNFELRREKKLLVVCPMNDDTDVRGLCIFSTSTEETRTIMDEDPAIKAGIFNYEIHATRSFAGDSL